MDASTTVASMICWPCRSNREPQALGAWKKLTNLSVRKHREIKWIWRPDVVIGALTKGCHSACFTVADVFSPEDYRVRLLNQAGRGRSYPQGEPQGSGLGFTSQPFMTTAWESGLLNNAGCPTQNGKRAVIPS